MDPTIVETRRLEDGAPGDVYFVACRNEFVKVGFALNVDQRLKELQTGCPYELTVIGVLRDTSALAERWFHAAMRSERGRGEWFKLTDRVRLLIQAVNDGFYPLKAEEIKALFAAIHRPGVAEFIKQEYSSPAPDPNGSCSTPI
jgi:hypothetical protein